MARKESHELLDAINLLKKALGVPLHPKADQLDTQKKHQIMTDAVEVTLHEPNMAYANGVNGIIRDVMDAMGFSNTAYFDSLKLHNGWERTKGNNSIITIAIPASRVAEMTFRLKERATFFEQSPWVQKNFADAVALLDRHIQKIPQLHPAIKFENADSQVGIFLKDVPEALGGRLKEITGATYDDLTKTAKFTMDDPVIEQIELAISRYAELGSHRGRGGSGRGAE